MKRPFVYIVGAGPGDAELMTLKAHRLLSSEAEVVIYDRLISEEIMAMVPPSVEKVYAGKSSHSHCITQEEINDMLLHHAAQGKIIVRLKGGDPFIFGRGGEEAEVLTAHNIPFEIVPGISAASACSSVLGIPLTHRGLATGVHYITGHSQKGEKLQLKWKKLVDPASTLVIYMGLGNLAFITHNLIMAGMDEFTPVIAIERGCMPEQRHVIAQLADIHEKVIEHNFQPPTLVIIGKVVGLYGNVDDQT